MSKSNIWSSLFILLMPRQPKSNKMPDIILQFYPTLLRFDLCYVSELLMSILSEELVALQLNALCFSSYMTQKMNDIVKWSGFHVAPTNADEGFTTWSLSPINRGVAPSPKNKRGFKHEFQMRGIAMKRLKTIPPLKIDIYHVHPHALASDISLSSILEEEALRGDDERSVGRIDVSMLVRKVPSEPNLEVAVKTIDLVMKHNIRISISTFSSLIQKCSQDRDLGLGRRVHEQLLENGYKANVLLANMLIDMYGKCGGVEDAQQVFDEMSKHNMYSWSALISAYAYKGKVQEAINLCKEMQNKCGSKPDKLVFVAIIKAIADKEDLDLGKQIHEEIKKSGISSDLAIQIALIDMYGKCRNLELADNVFRKLPEQNAEAWAALIAVYNYNKFDTKAFILFQQMKDQGVEPNEDIYISILETCSSAMDSQRGEYVHSLIVSSGYEYDTMVGSALVDMYIKCDNLQHASKVFDKLYDPDIPAWNSLILELLRQELYSEALLLYEQLLERFGTADESILVNLIKEYRNLGNVKDGMEAHIQAAKAGYDLNIEIGNSLVEFYASYNYVDDAQKIFDTLMHKDQNALLAMILSYAEQGLMKEAVKLYGDAKQEVRFLDKAAYASLINACANLKALDWGRNIHSSLLEYGLHLDLFVGNAVVEMYAKCGSLVDACVQLNRMLEEVNSEVPLQAELDHDTFFLSSILNTCPSLSALEKVVRLHTDIVGYGLETNACYASMLTYMYANCGRIDLARCVFNKMPETDAVLWNTSIGDYSQQGFLDSVQ